VRFAVITAVYDISNQAWKQLFEVFAEKYVLASGRP
jgi:hypothetical protein